MCGGKLAFANGEEGWGGNREELAVPASAAGVVWEPGKVAGSGGLGCAGRGPGEIL